MLEQLPALGIGASGLGGGLFLLYRLYVLLVRGVGEENKRMAATAKTRDTELETWRTKAFTATEKLATEEAITAGLEGAIANKERQIRELTAELERYRNP